MAAKKTTPAELSSLRKYKDKTTRPRKAGHQKEREKREKYLSSFPVVWTT